MVVVVARAWIPLVLLLGMTMAACMGKEAPLAAPGPVETGSSLLLSDAAGDAASAIDVLEANLTETPEHLLITIKIASLPSAGLAALSAGAGYTYASWSVCWDPESESRSVVPQFRECAGLSAEFVNGVADPHGYFEVGRDEDAGCNNWAWCAWDVPYQLTLGSPSLLSLKVPREILENGEKGGNLSGATILSYASKSNPTVSSTMGSRGLYAAAYAAGRGNYVRVPLYEPVESDKSAAKRFTFGTERVNTTGNASAQLLFRDAPRDVGGGAEGYRPELDLVSAELQDSKESLVVKMSAAKVDEAPTHDVYFSLGVGAHVFEAWYTARAGVVRDEGGGYCVDADCNSYKDYPIRVGFQKGSPGTITVTIQRSEVPDLLAGERANLADFYLYEPAIGDGNGVPGVGYAVVYAWGPYDWAWGAHPATIMSGE